MVKIKATSELHQDPPEPTWTKAELLMASGQYGARRDVLNVALDDDKHYTLAQIKKAVADVKGGLF